MQEVVTYLPASCEAAWAQLLVAGCGNRGNAGKSKKVVLWWRSGYNSPSFRCLTIRLRLEIEQFGVDAIADHQFRVRAAFRHCAIVKDDVIQMQAALALNAVLSQNTGDREVAD